MGEIRLHIRMKEGEMEAIRNKAGQKGVSVSRWVRDRLRKDDVVVGDSGFEKLKEVAGRVVSAVEGGDPEALEVVGELGRVVREL